MNNFKVQQQAAEQGGLFLDLSFDALEERNIKMFFFFFSMAMGIFNKYNIELIMRDEEGN